jgi:hypothetical protein
MRVCACGKKETTEEPFYKKTAVCRKCYDQKKKARRKDYLAQPGVRARKRDYNNSRRADPDRRAEVIWMDSRRSDTVHGRANDLTKDGIRHLIAQGCIYCGETQLKMTLDRKDNGVGHLQTNVIPCCIRCNYVRRDMPYEAWILLVPAMRQARERGLFGTWTCAVHHRSL